MGLVPGVPGSTDGAGFQVPIAAQTAVGLVPGAPGSVDATCPQVTIAAQTTVGLVPGIPNSCRPRLRCGFKDVLRQAVPFFSTREPLAARVLPEHLDVLAPSRHLLAYTPTQSQRWPREPCRQVSQVCQGGLRCSLNGCLGFWSSLLPSVAVQALIECLVARCLNVFSQGMSDLWRICPMLRLALWGLGLTLVVLLLAIPYPKIRLLHGANTKRLTAEWSPCLSV